MSEYRPEIGETVWLDMEEMGCVGEATVLGIDPCPEPKPGPGRLVLSVYRHSSGVTYSLKLAGTDETIAVTSRHPIWSEDRYDWVAVAELEPGELVRVLGGTEAVETLMPRAEPEPVFNLEVDADHCYRVGEQGILVHNASAPLPNPVPSTPAEVWCIIDEFRASRTPPLPVLGDYIPKPRDGKKSVALVIKAELYYGLNSTDRDAGEKQLARQYFDKMKEAGIYDGYNVPFPLAGAANFLTHSEAGALMEYHTHLKGAAPAQEVTFYNDRETCGKCLAWLALLLKYIGVKQITIISKNGAQHVVKDTDLPAKNDTPPDPE